MQRAGFDHRRSRGIGRSADRALPAVRRVLGPAAGRGAAIRRRPRRLAAHGANVSRSGLSSGSPARAAISTPASSSCTKKGSKNARLKRIALMDLRRRERAVPDRQPQPSCWHPASAPRATGSSTPTMSPASPRVYLMDIANLQPRPLEAVSEGNMTFLAAIPPDGSSVVFSMKQGGKSDIYRVSVGGGGRTQLTNAPSIETARPSRPTAARWCSKATCSGGQQVYVSPSSGGGAAPDQPGNGPLRHPGWYRRAATTSPSPSRRAAVSTSA